MHPDMMIFQSGCSEEKAANNPPGYIVVHGKGEEATKRQLYKCNKTFRMGPNHLFYK